MKTNIKIYITGDNDDKITAIARAETVTAHLTEVSGGVTLIPAVGVWYDGNKVKHTERVIIADFWLWDGNLIEFLGAAQAELMVWLTGSDTQAIFVVANGISALLETELDISHWIKNF